MTEGLIILKPDFLVSEYQPLVRFFAKKYSNFGVSKEDLFQEGMLGLLEAGNRFDPGQNVRFETYASYWIKKFILNAVNSESKHTFNYKEFSLDSIEAPNECCYDGQIVESLLPKSMPEIEQQVIKRSFDNKQTIKEIAHELNISPERVRQIRSKALRRLKNCESLIPIK